MGSEMCIRDRLRALHAALQPPGRQSAPGDHLRVVPLGAGLSGVGTCLLYTSDAADERSSVDLGGRRIIKKKKREKLGDRRLNMKKINKKIHKSEIKKT